MVVTSSVVGDSVKDWLLRINGVVPPFCVDLFLRNGIKYSLHSVVLKDESSVVIRIWDLRAFSEDDLEALKNNLNKIRDRSELSNERKVHPKLDWANLRIYLDEIDYCIEWHDRLWPMEERPQIGYDTGGASEG